MTNNSSVPGLVSIYDLPTRRNGKGAYLVSLPEVQNALKQICDGLNDDPFVGIVFDLETIARLRIKKIAKLLGAELRKLVEVGDIVSKSGKPLEVDWYTAIDTREVVCIGESDYMRENGLCLRRKKKAS